ncbi:DUF1573 domain-containing protein [uncultured Proteiniphilum sp.]|mgnify:CR=1 FL=1|uniref:DUF1573 domain-containing protein n=1 Tax=uncultured Proteiniphilum sp. TaxID=497637 RepID=UPI00262A1210|nr:DUF1573 domain-containing protein [uncultured Proteiniphilum sp.]
MYYLNFIKVFFISVIFFAIASCNNKNAEIHYNEDIENIIRLAHDRKKSFCIVLFNDSSSISSSYLEKLEEGTLTRLSDLIFNIINVALPENKWYTQWLGVENHVVTCVFSSSGILLATITGASSYSFNCINKSLEDDLSCNEFGYSPLFNIADNINKMDILSKILNCKIEIDQGQDIGTEIDKTLDVVQYPYNLYLKCLNSQKHGKKEEAIYRAKQLLTFDDIPYLKIYSDLYDQVKHIIDPTYDPDNGAILSIDEKNIYFNHCIINQSKHFKIKLTNEGNSMLKIENIDIGCSCVKLKDPSMTYFINPGDSMIISLEFTPDKIGELEREIFFVSNANNRLESIKIKALVE